MKDIYKHMNSQNILKFFGSKLDISIDNSEFYDYQIDSNGSDYDKDVIDFDTLIDYNSLTLTSDCITGTTLNGIKPWSIPINNQYQEYDCNFLIRRRTEEGWTLDFVFNRESNEWLSGSTFYYWGISGETVQRNFADNNLSFSFTDDGRIKWESYRYSGVCDTTSGYTESFYVSSGQTPVLCSDGTSSDFNITIVFDRYNYYQGCDIENEGGWNDMIGQYVIDYTGNTGSTTTQIVTGNTITNDFEDWVTGATITTNYIERLNKKWSSERSKRLGILKIYLNGRPIYKIDNWEEVIPSKRESENEIIQMWGGGVGGFLNIHTGTTEFNIKQIKYFEEPLDFVNIRHHYLTVIKPNFEINECNQDCEDDLYGFLSNILFLEDGEDFYITENNNIILY
jgi:hypothetical protein